MKRFLAVVIVACARPVAPAVTVSSPKAATVEPQSETLLPGCRVSGTGERRREPTDAYDEGVPFEVFASHDAHEAAFVLARPESAHVVWSHFPPRAEHGRARVAIGGQHHVRYEGWSDLYGRTFTTTRRLDSVAGHLWAHAGAPIDVISEVDGIVFARVATGLTSPKTIVVQGNCASLRYEPTDPPPHRERKIVAPLVNRDASFQLFASPTSGRPFTTITIASARGYAMDAIERRDGFVRVAGDQPHVGFDAWIRAAQLVDEPVVDRASEPRSASAFVGTRLPLRGSVPRDTQLFVGFDPAPLEGAVIEANAAITWDPRTEVTTNGRTFVSFEFADNFITGRLWIDKEAIRS